MSNIVGSGQARIIMDAAGEEATVTSNRLDVNAYLSATPTIDIGDVSLLLGGTAASVNNGAADATTLRVTVASDSTGVISVDDNGGSLTVDGTVTANLSATDNSVLDDISAGVSSVLVTTALIDDAIYADDADWSDGSSKHMLVGGLYQSSPQSITDGDVGPVQLDANGRVLISGTVDLGSTDNGVLDTIDSVLDTIKIDTEAIETAVETIAGAVSGSEMQVDIVSSAGFTATLNAGTAEIGKVDHQIDDIGHGVTVVTTAGSHVHLTTSTDCRKVDIQAQTDNTGYIAVGGSGVDATIATGTGVLLAPGDTFSCEIHDLVTIYIDSTVSGEGVRYTYWN